MTTSKYLLSLDISTNCTGWAVLDMDTKALITYGIIKGKNFKDTSGWRSTLKKLEYMAASILNVILNQKPTVIVIEEIAGSKNRISQKTLDMLHGILWKYIDQYLDIVEYYDVEGADGWRTHLQLRYSDADKLHNKEAKKTNEDLQKGIKKIHLIDKKVLACRFANFKFGLGLDPIENQSDADVGDAISMGYSFLISRVPTTKV